MKPPSWNQIRADAAAFVARWSGTTEERAESQTFWNEFLAIFGVDRKRVATFERIAQRASTKRDGRIDVFWPGVLIAEHKSTGRDLDDAEDQALDYLTDIGQDEFPGLLVVSDFARMRITDLGGDRVPFEFPLTDLVTEIDRFGYLAGYSGRQLRQAREHDVDIAAARLMGSLYEKVAATGFTEHETSVFLVRMLFVLFGDDTGLWEKSLFLEFLQTRTQPDGSDLGPQLALLFQTLDRPEGSRPPALDELLARFPYVNGGLFADRLDIPSFDKGIRDVLIECCLIDWGSIVPAIFGSLFQAVKSKEDRRLLGEHYTTEANILRVIRPLFLDDLRDEFDASFNNVRHLQRLRDRLGQLRFLDPACGCGNFLVIAYRELRQLELEILMRLRELTGEEQLSLDATLGLRVSLAQFHGIELEEWPARIAETALFLIDHQCNQILARALGQAPDRLPIAITADIRVGNAIDMNWNDVVPASADVYVMGNPPFIGMSWLTPEQQADNRTAFAGIDTYGLKTGRLDYVACWYAKAIGYLNGTTGRAAYVSTNSLTQGEQARTMLPLLTKSGYSIDFAHRTFKWTSEAPGQAAVHVVIVGFSPGGQAKTKRLFDYPDIAGEPKEYLVKNINFYLVDGPDIAPEKRSTPLISGLPPLTQGSKPWDGGHLLVEPEEYDEVTRDPIAARYLRPYRMGQEMLYQRDRWCLWLKDAPASDLRQSPILRERLRLVRETRLATPTLAVQGQAATPYLFSQDRQPNDHYLAIVRVSSEHRDYIPAVIYGPEVICGDKLLVSTGAPLWLFGYLQSAAFTTWARTFAGRLKSDISLSPSLNYYTFPFIRPQSPEMQSLERAAQGVLDAREAHPGSTLADLYDPLAMPADLRAAHNRLDQVIDGLYGLRHPSEGERLTALMAEYQRLATADQLDLEPKTKRRKSNR